MARTYRHRREDDAPRTKEETLKFVRGQNFRERTPASVGELMGTLVAGTEGMQRKMTANQRAAALWSQANGDIERKHTTGVYLRDARGKGLPPVLGVYVDSHARLSDFNANKEIYLSRLAVAGLEVSGIEFKLNRRPKVQMSGDGADGRQSEAPSGGMGAPGQDQRILPELTPGELAHVVEECSDLPEELRPRAQRAMELSLRREKIDESGA